AGATRGAAPGHALMGLREVLTGRRELRKPAADRLFAITTAAVAFEAGQGIVGAGSAAVVFQSLHTADFRAIVNEMVDVVKATAADTAADVGTEEDSYGFTWLVARGADLDGLAAAINAVASAIEAGGYGERLLCAVFPFRDEASGRLYWIYNFKRGSFYPFVPAGDQRRDNERELVLRAQAQSELPIEPELSRWFALWGIPI
ncbi:MAG: PspA-associated protein PspAB, partial [Solirubrobacteraceae bacterium]